MSEFGFLGFGLPDEVDPVEAVQRKAAAVDRVNEELERRGIVAFALKASSVPELEQRLLMNEVNNQINEVISTYLPGDDDAKRRVVSNIFRKFEAHIRLKDLVGEDIQALLTFAKPSNHTILYKCDECGRVSEEGCKTENDHVRTSETDSLSATASVISSLRYAEPMPMKNGEPAFLSEDEEEEEEDEEEEEEEDEDSEDEDEEDSEDDEDEDEDDEDESDEDDSDESEEDEDDSKGSKQSNRIIITEDSRGPIDPKTQFDLGGVRVDTVMTCPECKRKFDLMDEDQAGEWYYGHDCETE